ncbi:flagellar biosynthetic protein FliR [Ammoniphilus sp. CFH 90114]|uniref:flagellar biosynthetic protein FliR n=1 Tax=Ammoniphilus sp. CFH 90114 TaxID=2493665 RepID=UPI00100E5559|nr:flagellar biosynthetic protein FliR [Ammoniphilus sp. CFH 90114]RXT15128.1 flagellar type III secretion system protein FliR [Ammoniphilus sp. CFH 90114]
MNLFFAWDLFPSFLLIFVRLTSYFVTVPIFSSKNVPQTAKIGLAFFLSLITFTSLGIEPVRFDETYFLLILKEVFIGLTLGFIGTLILYAIQTAGGFIDMQMGLAMASVIDPQTGIHTPLMGQFKYILALLFLLSTNAHHLLIQGIIESYKIVPLDQLGLNISGGNITSVISQAFYHMFLSAFMIAAPIVVSLFLVDVALGIVARTVPQLNIFVIGIPIKLLTGFLILIVVLPGYFFTLKNLFKSLVQSMEALLKAMGWS